MSSKTFSGIHPAFSLSQPVNRLSNSASVPGISRSLSGMSFQYFAREFAASSWSGVSASGPCSRPFLIAAAEKARNAGVLGRGMTSIGSTERISRSRIAW